MLKRPTQYRDQFQATRLGMNIRRLWETRKGKVTVWGVLGSYLGLVWLVFAEIGVVAIKIGAALAPLVLLAYWFLLRTSTTPRWWGRLDANAACRWRFTYSVRRGTAVRTRVRNSVGADEVAPVDDSGVSFAIAPNGSVVATVAEGSLRVASVNRYTGNIYNWQGPIEIDKDLIVLAVSTKGNLDAWLAFARQGSIQNPSIWRVTVTELLGAHAQDPLPSSFWDRSEISVKGDGGIEYASFLGGCLLITHEEKVKALKPGKTSFSDWELTSSLSERIQFTAIDSAKIGGQNVVVLLGRPKQQGKGSKKQLIVVHSHNGASPVVHELQNAATHMSVIRGLGGDLSSVCVLTGLGTRMKAAFPLREQEAASAKGGGEREVPISIC